MEAGDTKEQGGLTPWLSHSSHSEHAGRASCSASVAQSRWDRGSTTTQAWRSCRKCHREPSKAVTLLQNAQPRHLPILKAYIPYGAAALIPGSSPRVHTVSSSLTSQKKHHPLPRQKTSIRAGRGQQQVQAPRSSSTHSELGAPKPRHQVQCLKTAEAARRQLEKAPY